MTAEQAGKEIFRLATSYGLTDLYADAIGARRGEYVGIINGKQISCTVFDRDPVADLAALRAAIAEAEAAPAFDPDWRKMFWLNHEHPEEHAERVEKSERAASSFCKREGWSDEARALYEGTAACFMEHGELSEALDEKWTALRDARVARAAA